MRTILHRSAERGGADHGWLQSRFSFSFADWYDPTRMGFGALRVINDDRIAPRSGFELHAHRDMEIITIVTAGAVTHEDSMGNAEKIVAGEVQVMTAGTGVAHSEHNRSATEWLELFQIWIQPRAERLRPRYAQYAFEEPQPGEPQLLVSPTGEGESILINQEAFIWRMRLAAGAGISHVLRVAGNGVYVLVTSGAIETVGERLDERDAVGVWEMDSLEIKAQVDTALLIIEVPMGA